MNRPQKLFMVFCVSLMSNVSLSDTISNYRVRQSEPYVFYDPCKATSKESDAQKWCYEINIGGQAQRLFSDVMNGSIDDQIGTFIDVSIFVNSDGSERGLGNFSHIGQAKKISIARQKSGYIKLLIRGYYFNPPLFAWTNHTVHREINETRINYWIDYKWPYKTDAAGGITLYRYISQHDMQIGPLVIMADGSPADEQYIPPSKKKQLQVRFSVKQDKKHKSASVNAKVPLKGAEVGIGLEQAGDKHTGSQSVVFLLDLDTSPQ